jgi:alpha/beta hydrolase family protein
MQTDQAKTTMPTQQNENMTNHPTLVLIHSPLVGPSTWQPAAECLRRKGFPTSVPELTTITPPYYQTFAETAAATATGPSILIGHSGAGALLPTIADRIGSNVLGAVFVDAVLSHPNQSWFDTAPPSLRDHLKTLVQDDDRLLPWNEWFPPEELIDLLPDEPTRARFIAEIPRLPLAYFTERAPATTLRTIRCAYLRLSEAYDDIATEAERNGWWVHRTDADHLAPYTQPDRIADLLIQAIEHITN